MGETTCCPPAGSLTWLLSSAISDGAQNTLEELYGIVSPGRPDDGEQMAKRQQVGIVDDHPTAILGVAAIINADPELMVAAAAGTVPGLLAQGATFDLVLLDLSLGDGTHPAENVQALVARGIPVLAYTAADQPALIREASRAGAIGMIRKSELPAPIIAAIRSALNGDVAASADWASAIDTDEHFVAATLSDREAEVLSLYASGETADRVAVQLHIGRETVLDHLRRIRAKYAALDRPAPSKLELHRRAVEDGLIPGNPTRRSEPDHLS
jgi:DNA-binding NarL/FixJ family response regulator